MSNSKIEERNKRSDIWKHFTTRYEDGKIDSDKKVYGKVVCNYCEENRNSKSPATTDSTLISSRPRDMRRHLNKCPYYKISKEKMSTNAGSSEKIENEYNQKREKRVKRSKIWNQFTIIEESKKLEDGTISLGKAVCNSCVLQSSAVKSTRPRDMRVHLKKCIYYKSLSSLKNNKEDMKEDSSYDLNSNVKSKKRRADVWDHFITIEKDDILNDGTKKFGKVICSSCVFQFPLIVCASKFLKAHLDKCIHYKKTMIDANKVKPESSCFSTNEKKTMESLAWNMVKDVALPMDFFDRISVQKFLQFLRPNCLPDLPQEKDLLQISRHENEY